MSWLSKVVGWLKDKFTGRKPKPPEPEPEPPPEPVPEPPPPPPPAPPPALEVARVGLIQLRVN